MQTNLFPVYLHKLCILIAQLSVVTFPGASTFNLFWLGIFHPSSYSWPFSPLYLQQNYCKMAKRPLPSSAFALPGLSKPDTKKPCGISYTKSTGHSKNLSTKKENGPVEDNFHSSPSLVDGKGSLLPLQTKHTLDNLTKTRPRNPGRRSPSPLARRKFEQDSLGSESVLLSKSSLEADSSKKSNHHRDVSNDRLNTVKERTAFSPALMITNDVGFSISSDELSVSRTSPRTSPRIRIRHQADRPEILPKPKRNLNRMNADHIPDKCDLVGNITDLTHDSKISEEHNNPAATMEPPPLPSSPPPLEDDIPASDPNERLHSDAKHSMQGSSFGKVIKTEDAKSLNSNLSRTLGNPIHNPDEVNGFSRTKQGRAATSSDMSSSSSRIAKWQGYGRTWSGENHASTGMAKVGVALSERQTSLDSAIASRLSKYDTPYSSRQRKSVNKSPSSRRRRFKPVSLVDESEMTNTPSIVETQSTDSLSKVYEYQSQLISERLHGVQAGKFLPGQALPKHLTNRTEIQTDGLSLSGSNTKNRFQRNVCAPEKKVKPVTGSSLRASTNIAGQSYVENSRQHPSLSDKFAMNRTNPEPTVLLEYDVRNSEEKVIEVETNETVPFVVSDRSGMYRSKADYLKRESKDSRAVIDSGLNERPDMQEGNPPVTLPKVVIEYDGEVVRDSVLHGYDTENSSDEANLSKSSFDAEEDTFNLQQKEQESDGSSPVENGGDLQYSDYSDEEEDLDLVLDDVSLDDEDLTFEDLDSARQKMKQDKGMFFVFIRHYRSSSE